MNAKAKLHQSKLSLWTARFEDQAASGLAVKEWCKQNDISIYACLINPIQTSTMRKNNIRKTKTDKVDTFIICKTLMMHPHRFVTLYDIGLMQLKNLGRFRQKIVKQRTRLKFLRGSSFP